MTDTKLKINIEIALMAVLALSLDLLAPSLPGFKISIKMLPIIILALRRGTWPGIIGGLLWGLLQFLIGDADILTITQFLLEYFVAFALVGLAGLFYQPIQENLHQMPENKKRTAYLASFALIIGSATRYLIHFIAGFIFWGQYAPEGQSAILYSFTVNFGAFFSETLTSWMVLLFLLPYAGSLIKTEPIKEKAMRIQATK